MGRRQRLCQLGYDVLQALPCRQPDRPRIRMITGYDDAIAGYGDLAARNHAAYARRHGYDHRVHRRGFDPARPPAWSKILFTLGSMSGADWVVWIDADLLIADPSRRLEDFIPAGCDFLLARHQAPSPHANTGFYFVRNRWWTRRLLRHTYSLEGVIHHPMWEQTAFNILLDRHQFPRLRIVPGRTFNSLREGPCAMDLYQPGDFAVHFAGLPAKAGLMRAFLEESGMEGSWR